MSQSKIHLDERQQLNHIELIQVEPDDTVLRFAVGDGSLVGGYKHIPKWTDSEVRGNLFALVQTRRWSELLTFWAHCNSPILCSADELRNITDLNNPLLSNLKGAPVKSGLKTVEWVFAPSLGAIETDHEDSTVIKSMDFVGALYSREALQSLLLLAAYAQGHGSLFDVVSLVSRSPFSLACGVLADWDLEPADVLVEDAVTSSPVSLTNFLKLDMGVLQKLQNEWFDVDIPPRILAGNLFLHYYSAIEKKVGKGGTRLSSNYNRDFDSTYEDAVTFSWGEYNMSGDEQKVMSLIADMATKGHIGTCAYCGLPIDITPRRGGSSSYCSNTCRQNMVYKNKALDWHRDGDSLGLICEKLGRFGRPLVQKWIITPTDEEFLANCDKYISRILSEREVQL